MMKPEIFIGLGKPTSPLFLNLQNLIEENGGRLRLAQIIHNENASNRFVRKKAQEKLYSFKHYSKEEDEKIINGDYIKLTNRSMESIRKRRWVLRQKGIIKK
jgi:hypothetical protein